jgi:hypothetical protein
MQMLRPALITLFLGTCLYPALGVSASAQTCTCGGIGVRSEVAPPPLPEYDQPAVPGPGYLWTPGYWAWNSYDYYWVPGTWVEPPQEGLLWTPGYWDYVDGVYAFNAGYWGPHVGYYGGVSYGFGYGGSGYEGGYWQDGAFFYNRSVNNITNVRITNVYNKTVVVNNVSNRVSFSGPGGTNAKPTAEELTIAKEPHVQPTTSQIAHARTASMKSDLFDSTNHGKPAIAATIKPAAFTGPGVVKAKSAGVQSILKPAGEGLPGKDEKKGLEKNDLKPASSESETLRPKEDKKNLDVDTLKPLPKKVQTNETSGDHKLPGFSSEKKLPATETKTLPSVLIDKHVARPQQQPLVAKPAPQPFVAKPAPVIQHTAPAPHVVVRPACGVPGKPKCP